jgi:hypothetical protein
MKRYLIGFLLILSCGTLTTSRSQVSEVVYYPNQESIVEVIQIVDEETGAVIAAKIVDYE